MWTDINLINIWALFSYNKSVLAVIFWKARPNFLDCIKYTVTWDIIMFVYVSIRYRVRAYICFLLLEGKNNAKAMKNNIIFQRSELKSEQSLMASVNNADRKQHLGKLILVVRVDAEARHGSAGEAGAVRQFPHSADVTHGFIFQSGRRDFHLILLVWRHTHTHSGFIVFNLDKVINAMWTEITFWSRSPMKVLEMYSDTWFPERLISDRWESSLFSILLNCGRMRTKHKDGVSQPEASLRKLSVIIQNRRPVWILGFEWVQRFKETVKRLKKKCWR